MCVVALHTGAATERKAAMSLIRNAATPGPQQGFSPVGFTSGHPVYGDPSERKGRTRSRKTPKPSQHLSRGDGTPYFKHNKGR